MKRKGITLIELGVSLLLSIILYTISLNMIKEYEYKSQVKEEILKLEEFIFDSILGKNKFGWLLNSGTENCSQDGISFKTFSPVKVEKCLKLREGLFPIVRNTVGSLTDDEPSDVDGNIYDWKYLVLKEYADKKACEVKFGLGGTEQTSLYIMMECFGTINPYSKGIYAINMFNKMMTRHNTVDVPKLRMEVTALPNGANDYNYIYDSTTLEVDETEVLYYEESTKREPILFFKIDLKN